MKADIFYLKKSNRSTLIVGTTSEIVELTINNLIDKELEKSLSNMEGRLLSTKRVYNIKKFTPIYINQNIILQPLNSYKDWDLTMVNICNIASIESCVKTSKIISKSGTILEVAISKKRLETYINNCLTIKNKQNIIEREGILYGKKEY